ncbi:MAG: type II CRISPR-associated endonuclease Cas1 [Hydrogenovibrio sp.]|uniref:type II CRISPR-associated endonuclease Cas1 n=1 Tax=Hydrogenovibrio sp. TaxID=2065821 RepID=UPI00287015FC|nr:type II CRISPR-associated endonuclease Cas1 [Hydrogenovibrio sp.]MDR9498162.1 type II CRISPR-associated endonuclease Cas1 [Hydrogenovibrio sp.]
MAWRTILMTRPGYLSLKQASLCIRQEEGEAHVSLEDVAAIVLDNAQLVLTAQLVSALAARNIALITVDEVHVPNGVLLSYLPHSRAVKVMRTQLQMGKAQKKRLWQNIIQQKISNQASVLQNISAVSEASLLEAMSQKVKSGDPDNYEAQASQTYFKALFGKGFVRREDSLVNAALNYGYSIVRSLIARQLVGYGFLTALGLHHCSEQNAFNLADDLMEPYRPHIDWEVMQLVNHDPSQSQVMSTSLKASLVQVVHQDIVRLEKGQTLGQSTLLALVEATVISLSQRLSDQKNCLVLPGEVIS